VDGDELTFAMGFVDRGGKLFRSKGGTSLRTPLASTRYPRST